MGVHGEALATGHTLTFGDRTVRLKLIEQEDRARFAAEFFAEARRLAELERDAQLSAAMERLKAAEASGDGAAARQALLATEQDHETKLEDLRDDYYAGKFDLLSRRGRKSLTEPQGAVRLLRILTGEKDEALFQLIRDPAKQAEIRVLLGTIFHESFPGMADVPPGVAAKKNGSPESK